MKLRLTKEEKQHRYEMVVDYTPARPGSMYLSNGDPGDPPEDAECWLDSYTAWQRSDAFEIEDAPCTADWERFDSPCLWDKLQAWLDANPDKVEEVAAADREYAEEMRAEQRRGRWGRWGRWAEV